MNKSLCSFIALLCLVCATTAVRADQHQTQGIDFTVIHQQAELANAAYQSEIHIQQYLASQSLELTGYGTIDNIQIAYMLVTDKRSKQQTIAVRGTSNIENAMVDITLKLVLDERSNLYLHRGFAHAAKQVYTAIKPLLNREFTINTTGHSLGGAVAVLLAMYLDFDGYQNGRTMTFGQPKVTNLKGAQALTHLNILRIVTARDLVPLVPLFDPLDINNLDIFWHSGQEIVLLEDRQFAILTGINSMLRATRFTQQPLNEENLRHHSMKLYLDSIAQRIESAEQVDYQNSFNLFNLFGNE